MEKKHISADLSAKCGLRASAVGTSLSSGKLNMALGTNGQGEYYLMFYNGTTDQYYCGIKFNNQV